MHSYYWTLVIVHVGSLLFGAYFSPWTENKVNKPQI